MIWRAMVAMMCVAAMLPPMPLKGRYRPVRLSKTTQGAGALALITHPRTLTPLSSRLTWEWTPDVFNRWTDTVFLVCSNGSLTIPRTDWPVFVVSSTNSIPLTVNPSVPAAFFTVFASNQISGIVSQ